jgi:hypothetical protein
MKSCSFVLINFFLFTLVIFHACCKFNFLLSTHYGMEVLVRIFGQTNVKSYHILDFYAVTVSSDGVERAERAF